MVHMTLLDSFIISYQPQHHLQSPPKPFIVEIIASLIHVVGISVILIRTKSCDTSKRKWISMVHNLSEKVSAHTATKHELIIIVHFSLSNSNFQLTSVYKVDTPAYDNPMYDPPPIVLPNDTTVVELSTFKKYVTQSIVHHFTSLFHNTQISSIRD